LKARGVASVAEALLVSISIVVLVAIAFSFFHSHLGSMNPVVRQTHVEAVLCGRVFAAKNVGQHPAKIERLVMVQVDQNGVPRATELVLEAELAPRKKLELNLTSDYVYVYFLTGSFRSKPIPNDCAWVTVSRGGGGGGGGGGGIPWQ